MYGSVCTYVYLSPETHGGQKKGSDLLELELSILGYVISLESKFSFTMWTLRHSLVIIQRKAIFKKVKASDDSCLFAHLYFSSRNTYRQGVMAHHATITFRTYQDYLETNDCISFHISVPDANPYLKDSCCSINMWYITKQKDKYLALCAVCLCNQQQQTRVDPETKRIGWTFPRHYLTSG